MPNVPRVGWKTSRAIGSIAPRGAAEIKKAIVVGPRMPRRGGFQSALSADFQRRWSVEMLDDYWG